MQGQLDSAKASPSVVAMDITVANKSENGCTDVVGASGHADVNMDPINGDDPSSAQSKANDADVLLKNKDGNKENKNCAENSGLLQESSAGRKRRRGKRKWASANGGPGFSSDNGDVDAKHSLHSSANHGLSCTCASCLVEAHEEKIRNIYSPRGSLVRFQRKKLLILDLNGLLADINQDYHNAHLAHALLSFGVFIAATSVTRLLPKPLAACPHGHFFFIEDPWLINLACPLQYVKRSQYLILLPIFCVFQILPAFCNFRCRFFSTVVCLLRLSPGLHKLWTMGCKVYELVTKL